jgi:hypothetical protein
MNKQEIDEMMKDLPSQHIPEETFAQKVIIGIMFILLLVLMTWVPDFILSEHDCAQQESSAYVGDLCKEVKKP